MTMLFKRLERMINGDLRPHLINKKNLRFLTDEFKTTVIIDKETGEWIHENEDFLLFLKDGDSFTLKSKDANDVTKGFLLTIDTPKEFQELIDIRIPPPPTFKAEQYLRLIKIEKAIIFSKVKSFFAEAKDNETVKFFAIKNIQILKDLAGDLRVYTKHLHGINGNLFTSDENHFIVYVLKLVIIELIQYLQKSFYPFINMQIQSDMQLQEELFYDFHIRKVLEFIKQEELHITKIEDLTTFAWKGETKQKDKLFELLDYNKFIETNKSDFDKIFSGCKLSEIVQPIKWTVKSKNGSPNKRSIIDLIRQLADHEMIEINEVEHRKLKGGHLFEKIQACFVDFNGNKFDSFNYANVNSSVNYQDFTKIIVSL